MVLIGNLFVAEYIAPPLNFTCISSGSPPDGDHLAITTAPPHAGRRGWSNNTISGGENRGTVTSNTAVEEAPSKKYDDYSKWVLGMH